MLQSRAIRFYGAARKSPPRTQHGKIRCPRSRRMLQNVASVGPGRLAEGREPTVHSTDGIQGMLNEVDVLPEFSVQ